MPGKLLMVTPPVLVRSTAGLRIDPHFANNLAGYLKRVDRVAVACSVADEAPGSGISNGVAVEDLPERDRIDLVLLPEPYREDRYLRHRSSVRTRLRREIETCDYLTVAPHAPFDWPMLAAKIAWALGRPYDIEVDWDMRNVCWMLWSTMKPGPNKFRKYLWFKHYLWEFDCCMKRSSLAMLQGADVFDAYRTIAPNPHKVLNLQVVRDDFITPAELAAKKAEVLRGHPLRISYAGRAIDMKGPFDWLKALRGLKESGVRFEATWFGDGNQLDAMRAFVDETGLGDIVRLAGSVDREQVMRAVRRSHLFLFCHLTNESPRCVVEALANGSPIIGYDSLYVRDLVATGGGGQFAKVGDWNELTKIVTSLDQDRDRLASLMTEAAKSAESFDRDRAIEHRVALIVDAFSASPDH